MLLSIAVISCYVAIAFHDILFTGQTFFARDLTYLFHPWRTYAAECIQKGEIPLWNPYAYCGMPFMANMQSAVWYPFTVFFYIFQFILALKLFYFIHYGIAAFFMFLLAKKKKIIISGALLIGLLWSQNGYMMTKVEFLSILGTAIWMPALCILRKNILLLALAFTVSYCAGYPQIVFFQICALVIFILMYDHNKYHVYRGLVYAGVMAIILSALQLIPSSELLFQSIRGVQGLAMETVKEYAVSFKQWIGLCAPYFVRPDNHQITGEKIFWANGMHIGILGCIVAMHSLFKMPFLKKIILLLFGILCIMIGIGAYMPFFPILYDHIFLYKLIRYPSSIIYLFMVLIMMFLYESPLLRKRIALLLLIISAGELLWLNHRLYPTAPSSYFYARNETVSFLQNNEKNTRYFLTPKTQIDLGIYSDSVPDGWLRIKDRLLGQVGVPYHIHNADGIGEPLITEHHEEMIQRIKSAETIQDAKKRSIDAGIGYFVCSYPVNNTYHPIILPNGISIIVNENIVHHNLPHLYYPGWYGYKNGDELELKYTADGWLDSREYNDEIRMMYRPFSWLMGIIITCGALIIMLWTGFRNNERAMFLY